MGIQSIDKAVVILDLLSRNTDGLPISEICAKLDMPLGTAHRFLHSLIDNGLVAQDEKTKFYRLGLKMLRLTAGMLNGDRLIEVSRAPMLKAAAALKNIVYLSRESNAEVVCISCVNETSSSQAKFAAQLGNDMPFHAAAAGKIIAAFFSDKKIRSLIECNAPLMRYTDKTKTSQQDVFADLKKCREQGYAVCDEELELGVIAVAAPIRNYDGTVKASVAVTGIKANVSEQELIDSITKCSFEISNALGFA